MYAGMKVNWHEVLMANPSTISTDESLPLFLCAFSADKGSEEITDFTYSEFRAMYGDTANFAKYGQPLLQAHNILSSGGRVLGKRIVANDSKLANIIILAEVSEVEEEVDDETITYAKIKYSTDTVASATSFDDVVDAAEDMQTTTKFPLFIITDNGRGKSIKKIKINPDYDVSKKLDYMLYKISDIEGTNTVETSRFSIYPDAVATVGSGIRRNMSLDINGMSQIKAKTYTTGMNAFLAKLSDITDYTIDELYTFDVLFGKTVKRVPLESIQIDSTGTDITTEYGISLGSGSNGSFGDNPFVDGEATSAWATAAVNFFNGTFSDEIYDLDQHKIDFCLDANYPDTVKAAIATLADFREDFYFFRDLGLDIHTISDVQDKVVDAGWKQTPFAGDYISTYDIIDPFSRKQIKVTSTYGLSSRLVSHYMNNASAPLAGEFNNFVITDAVPGTLNIIPRVTPTIDQKEILDDLKVNFLNLTSDGLLAIQSTYTSQDHDGPLSYANNVIITQMCIKAIRRYCPKIRFMLMDPGASDFGQYKVLIEDNVISKYKQYFKQIELRYTADYEQINAKIFNASLICYYRDFPQGEIFDVFAVEGSPELNPM